MLKTNPKNMAFGGTRRRDHFRTAPPLLSIERRLAVWNCSAFHLGRSVRAPSRASLVIGNGWEMVGDGNRQQSEAVVVASRSDGT